MSDNFQYVKNGINLGSLPTAPANPRNGDIYYDTGLNTFRGYVNGVWVSIPGSGSSTPNPITLTQISTPANPPSGSNSFYFKNDNIPYILNSAGVETPLLSSGSSAFATYQSSQVVTGSAISGSVGTFQTFSTSPAFTITPTITGTYKVYASLPLVPGPGDNVPFYGRIFNTSGGATLLAESQVLAIGFKAGVTDPGFSGYAQSTYTLIAGNTYVFDIQGMVASSGTLTLSPTPFYMFAEGIGLNGSLNTGGSSFALFTSNVVNTISSPVASVAPTFTTFSNSPAFTFTPVISGIYKIYASVPLETNSSTQEAVCKIFNTSGGATLLSESQGVAYSDSPATVNSAYCQSTYQLVAGTPYVFDVQGAVTGSGPNAFIRGDVAQFYMYAEGIGLSLTSQNFPVKMKAYGSFSGSGTIILGNVSYDSNSGYNPATGQYTVPYAGDYVVGFSAQSSSGGIIAIPFVNGAINAGATTYFFDTSGRNGDIAAAEIHLGNLKAGDVVTWNSQSSTVYNALTTLWIYSVALNNALMGPNGRTTGSAFAYFASSAVSTLSTLNASTSFVTFNNSPAFSFTPTISGIYKVYTAVPLNNQGSNSIAGARVFNTSGGATLLQESQAVLYAGTPPTVSNEFIQSVYSLNAGTTYVFDIQGQVNGGSGVYLDASERNPFYMFAEGIGLSGQFQSPLTPWSDSLTFTPSPGFGTVTNSEIEYRVIGDSIQVRGQFQCGTVSATTAYIQLPTGYVIDFTKLPTTYTQSVGWSQQLSQNGSVPNITNADAPILFTDGATTNQIFFSYKTSANNLEKNNSNNMFNTSDTVAFDFSVPIVGLYGGQLDGISNIAKSNSTGVFGFSNTLIPVLDSGGVNPVRAVVTTNGGDVEVGFQADGSSNPSYIITDSTPTDSSATLNFYRDGVLISSQFMYMQNNIAIEIHGIPASSFKYIDSPPAGTHIYTAQVVGGANRGDQAINYSVLYAKPLSALAGASGSGNGSGAGTYAQAYFGSASGWSTTSASYVDPTNSGGNALTIRESSGINLTAAAGNVCGITFTPPTSNAVYLITATFPLFNTTTDGASAVKLTDGTEDISTAMMNNTNTGNDVITPTTLSGIYVPGVNTPVTVRLELAAVGGTAHINNLGATTLVNAVEWTVIQLSNGSGPSSWTAYTPTFTGMGTVTGATFWYKYDGADSIHIKGTWTTGTPTGTQAQISLPPGFVSQGSKINGTIESCGTMNHNNSNSVAFAVTIQPNVSYVTFGFNSNTGGDLNPDLGNVVFASSTVYSFSSSAIPIS
jgi:hypothetical protein